MKQVVWTRAALADLTAIYEHIAADSPRYAVAVVDRLTKRSQQLAAFPRLRVSVFCLLSSVFCLLPF